MGLGKRGRLRVDKPTITGRTHPAPDARSPLFACLCRSIRRTQSARLNAFFLETEARAASAVPRSGGCITASANGRSQNGRTALARLKSWMTNYSRGLGYA
jgi:hypothetical protein